MVELEVLDEPEKALHNLFYIRLSNRRLVDKLVGDLRYHQICDKSPASRTIISHEIQSDTSQFSGLLPRLASSLLDERLGERKCSR